MPSRHYKQIEARYEALRASESRRNPEPCYDPVSGTLVGDPYDGLPVMLIALDEAAGRVLVRHESLPNQEAYFPICPDDPGGRLTIPEVRPDEGCCVDERTGLITCTRGAASSYMHGRTVPLSTVTCFEDASGRWCEIHTGDNQFLFRSCPQPPDLIPPPPPPPDLSGCCIDPQTGIISCPGGTDQFYMHGRQIPAGQFTCQNGTCQIFGAGIGEGDMVLPACPTPPDLIPPPGTPPQCCYDVASGTLRCNGGEWDGLAVSLLAMQPQADGSILAIVMSEQLRPNSTMAFPICDDPVVECCYDPTTETLVCPGSDLDGTAAGIVVSWADASGQIYVWAVWNGGGARMPLCPGTTECPPMFCCINLQTFELVCPGRPELNGTKGDVVDFVQEDGFTWGIMADGTRIPICGQRCPPPQLCPDCPTCPPGQFLSPDGTCHEPPVCPPQDEPCPPGMWRDPNGACVPPPTVPQCPPGLLLDTTTMQCVHCPSCPPKEPCCDDCAHGGPCSGCPDGRKGASGGARRIRHAGPQRNPSVAERYQGSRKRKIFAGNR